MIRWLWRSLLRPCSLVTFTGSAHAQGMGSIFGKVTDSSGAVDARRHRDGDGHRACSCRASRSRPRPAPISSRTFRSAPTR